MFWYILHISIELIAWINQRYMLDTNKEEKKVHKQTDIYQFQSSPYARTGNMKSVESLLRSFDLPSVKKTCAALYFGTKACALSKSFISSVTDYFKIRKIHSRGKIFIWNQILFHLVGWNKPLQACLMALVFS